MTFRFLSLACMSALALSAQAPGDLQTFRVEYRLEFTEQSASVLGAELGPAVLTGEREVRQQVVFDAPGKRLTVRTFSVVAGAPKTTALKDAQAGEVENYRVDVKDVSVADRGFLFEGTVAENPRVFLAPVVAGDPWSLEADWYGSTNISFTQIWIDFVGTTAFIPGGTGVFEFSSTPNHAPVIGLAATPDTVFQPEVSLDATATADQDKDALTFWWHSARGSVSIAGADSATPRVQFHSGPGRYDIILTVTDARGAVAEKTVSVAYYGR